MTDYTELIRSLRCENTGDDECGSSDCTYWSGLGCMDGQLMEDAADAIEELQAEVERLEPKQRKLGRWEKAKPKGVVVYSDGYAECSSCHEVIWLGWGMNFCPHCGVQNRIIDPDDMAKMEVQE